MRPEDVPTHITRLVYSAPGPAMSQNDAAKLLAHYWGPIEKHIRSHASAYILGAREVPPLTETQEHLNKTLINLAHDIDTDRVTCVSCE